MLKLFLYRYYKFIYPIQNILQTLTPAPVTSGITGVCHYPGRCAAGDR